MDIKEIKDFLITVLNKELEEELVYQENGERDTSYIKKCITAKRWLLKNSKGIEQLVNNMIIKEDIETYIKIFESENK